MRIKEIEISWFRGAADPVSLELNSKSTVVYGLNGSGKSSFVDAVEYVLNDGRIKHLAHEYSGKRQEKAVPNTHKPADRKPRLEIVLRDNSQVSIEIGRDGNPTTIDSSGAAILSWDYRRTVLRQDEVSEFIHDTKGQKYSALLPLLGLDRMEVAAENLRKLAKLVEERSKLGDAKAKLKEIGGQRKAVFGAYSDLQILTQVRELYAKYCKGDSGSKDGLALCDDLKMAIGILATRSTEDQRRYLVLQEAGALTLESQFVEPRASSEKLRGVVEPFVAERLEVLASAATFAERLGDLDEEQCPACGRSIQVRSLRAHLDDERQRLREIAEVFESRKRAIGKICDTVMSLRGRLRKPEVKPWRDDLSLGPLGVNLDYLESVDLDSLRTTCTDTHLGALEANLLPIVNSARAAAEVAPPKIEQLSADRSACETARAVMASGAVLDAAKRAEGLLSFVSLLEGGVRDELRLRSRDVVEAISADIQAMWAILHPGKAIEQTRLCIPNDADKAIDISLKFYGVEQESPRLTLSEGYRNSLGLCIFLAMAKQETEDRPLFLDDVVVSLDRNHRGMVVELLERHFKNRQVVIFTHDREWYTDLRQQLDEREWTFKTLLPYETPDVGIRWSKSTTTFGDARAHLKDRPDSAANDARKIMDVEVAQIAERLQTWLPYLRADRNDKRTAHEFLERLVADGTRCFQRKVGDEYESHADAIAALGAADRLLISWGNRGSHSFDVVQSEASELIDACEAALNFFKCTLCGKSVWFADAEGAKLVQCACSQLRWRYGNA